MADFHTAIIGAGASGLFCAGSFNASKIILDHNAQPGVKINVSGGGKCNFSNLHISAKDYLCHQPHFCKNALASFRTQDFISLLEKAHIPYEERQDGQLFSQTSAKEIVRLLVQRARENNTRFSLNTQVLSVSKGTPDFFIIQTSSGNIRARNVVLACGGLSYPSLGASSIGIQIARQFGLAIIPQRPALCGLTAPKALRSIFCTLAGNSLKTIIHIKKQTFTGDLLFTHEGISGPVVLQASVFCMPQQEITINFVPQIDVLQHFYKYKNSSLSLASSLKDFLSCKITKSLLGELERDLANASKQELQTAANRLQNFTFVPCSTAGYTRAEVTAGGIDTKEINPHTFACKKVPGLYAVGELLDVTGRLGGFNLHWAWASGYAAGQALSKIV